jgi:hypothetical protein
MKKLAEVEEILEDYDQKLTHNNKVARSIVIDLITDLWYKVNTLHKYKLLLEEYCVPHGHDSFTLQQNSDSENVADNHIKSILERWGGETEGVCETKAFNLFKKFVEPYLLKDETDGEPDGDF